MILTFGRFLRTILFSIVEEDSCIFSNTTLGLSLYAVLLKSEIGYRTGLSIAIIRGPRKSP